MILSILLLSLWQVLCFADASHRPVERPNIIFILSDDQDLLLGSLNYQPSVQNQFREQGTFFGQHYCNVAVCCPSRVSLLTGKMPHSTNITDVKVPYGGYSRFTERGLNGQWLPSYFQDLSYNTYYTGKLMNNHSVVNYNNPYPAGFNGTDFLIDPGTYIYYNATMQSNRDPPRNLPGQYSTDVVAQRAVSFLDEAAKSENPFFLTVAPIGPHGQTVITIPVPGQPRPMPQFQPPVAADKYKDLYQGVKVPRTDNYNPDVANGPSYFKTLPKWNQTVIDYYDEFYRIRLATLASNDDLIDSVIAKAESLGIMNNTYIIYTSDNGFHIGQHRLPAGKSCGIEEDIRVPFFIRGPGIAKNVSIEYPTSHIDIAPTLFDIAGFDQRPEFDGAVMPIWPWQRGEHHGGHHPSHGSYPAPSSGSPSKPFDKQEHVNVEFWGANFGEGTFANGLLSPTNNNTYKAMRLISVDKTFDLAYLVWCTNEHELYDMTSDPGQLDNLAVEWDAPMESSTPAPVTMQVMPRRDGMHSAFDFGRRPGRKHNQEDDGPAMDDPTYRLRLQARLDTLLMVLKTCQADTCRDPWSRIHPQGDVRSLKDALNPKYDDFYVNQQPKIRFDACAQGYIRKVEGPGDDRGDVKIYNPDA